MQQSNLQSLIPQTKLEAVLEGLRTAFGSDHVDSIVPLSGGLSTALVYKISVCGEPYVLRIIMNVDALNDPARQFTCMTLAAAAGVAPTVYYANVEDALSITAWIATTPLVNHFTERENLLVELAKTIKAIHATPLFPKLVNFLDGVDGFIQEVKATGLLPESATAEHFAYYAHIQQSYPRHDTDVVSSHNDLNHNNILFDGKRIWIIDWEAAFQNDRYADLASIANGFVYNERQEELYLQVYFGDTLDEYKRARLFLMQQVSHIFYAMVMLKLVAASRTDNSTVEATMQVPRIADFRKQLGEGQVNLASAEGQLLFAKVELNEALLSMKSPRFAASIDLMNQHH